MADPILYRKIIVKANEGPQGDPVVLTLEEAPSGYLLLLWDADNGTRVLLFERYRNAAIEAVVEMARWGFQRLSGHADQVELTMRGQHELTR